MKSYFTITNILIVVIMTIYQFTCVISPDFSDGYKISESQAIGEWINSEPFSQISINDEDQSSFSITCTLSLPENNQYVKNAYFYDSLNLFLFNLYEIGSWSIYTNGWTEAQGIFFSPDSLTRTDSQGISTLIYVKPQDPHVTDNSYYSFAKREGRYLLLLEGINSSHNRYMRK